MKNQPLSVSVTGGIGMGIGTAMGVALGNLELGLSVGAITGVVLGLMMRGTICADIKKVAHIAFKKKIFHPLLYSGADMEKGTGDEAKTTANLSLDIHRR